MCFANAPRAWYRQVRKDLEAVGWRVHQLDQCVFMIYDGNDFIGICGAYVDDFILAAKTNDPRQNKPNRASLICTSGKVADKLMYAMWRTLPPKE